jgi:hypothetical protein
MITEIKYIRKDIEDILMPSKNEEYDRYNCNNWMIVTDKPEYQTIYSNARYKLGHKLRFGEVIQKQFFTFIFIGENFPNTSRKEILPIIQKYKFAKIYVPRENNKIECRYFKRGVFFHFEYDINKNNKKSISIIRLFKLIKLNSKSTL